MSEPYWVALGGSPTEQWFTGSGAPSGSLAGSAVGDWYLDSANGDYYEKTGATTWTNRGSLKGATGPAGSTGSQGPAGDPGAPGTAGEKWFSGSGVPAGGTGAVGDWYIDTATGDFYEKTGASTWTVRGNLKGPQGNTGATGTVNPFRYGHTWAISGAVAAVTLPVMFVPKGSAQTVTLIGVRAKVGGGTSVVAQIQRNGSNLGSAITVTTTAATTAFSQALSDLDTLGVVLSTPTGSPTDLSLTLILEHTP